MSEVKPIVVSLAALDSLTVDVLTDDVSDNYVSKTLFAVSEFSNVIRGGANIISGEALLCANLGFRLRLVSDVGGTRHTLLFDTGPEGAIFIRNCTNLGHRWAKSKRSRWPTDTGTTWPLYRRRSMRSWSRAGR